MICLLAELCVVHCWNPCHSQITRVNVQAAKLLLFALFHMHRRSRELLPAINASGVWRRRGLLIRLVSYAPQARKLRPGDLRHLQQELLSCPSSNHLPPNKQYPIRE